MVELKQCSGFGMVGTCRDIFWTGRAVNGQPILDSVLTDTAYHQDSTNRLRACFPPQINLQLTLVGD